MPLNAGQGDSQPGQPEVTVISDDELLLASRDNLGIFMTFQGTPMPRSPVRWTRTPTRLVCCDDYVLALLPNGTVEVVSIPEQRRIQTIPFAKGVDLAASKHRVSLAASDQLSVLLLTSRRQQAWQYMDRLHIPEALQLLRKDAPSATDLCEFHTRAGWTLFRGLQFASAFQYFARAG